MGVVGGPHGQRLFPAGRSLTRFGANHAGQRGLFAPRRSHHGFAQQAQFGQAHRREGLGGNQALLQRLLLGLVVSGLRAAQFGAGRRSDL